MSDPLDDPLETTQNVYPCQKDGCENPLPAFGTDGFHPARKYCDDHQPKKKKDSAPRVTVNLGNKPKATAELETYERAAAMYLGFLPVVFLMAGDEVCSTALGEAIPQMSKQIAQLTEYHPGLKKILSPSESVGELVVWSGILMAMGPAITAILVHHNILPEKLAALAQATFLVGAGVTGE